MGKMTIIEGNSNDKDNVRAYMVKGERGDDGISPTFETSKTGGTTTITITDAEGTQEVEIDDGFSPTVSASKSGKVTTVTITDIDGTETATINDGVDLTGGVPTSGVIAFDGVVADIPDGYEVSSTSFATITDSYSTSTTEGYSCNYVNGIIESGSNANGNYIKYADGTMICTKKVEFSNIAITNTWGSFYESTSLDIGSYAVPFISTPAISLTSLYPNFVEKFGDTSATGWGHIYACKPRSATENVAVDCIAIGKWK